ncbi:MAG: cytochrome P450 [Hyphomonadaceae bacterium]
MANECPFDAKAFNENFDHHDPQFGLNREAVFDDMRARCPVGTTSAWGGYHILTRYEDVVAAAKDDATFTSEPGITIPGLPATQLNRLPISIDPPRSFFYRNILAKFFTVRWLNALEPWTRDLVNGFVDDFIETGRADLQTQLGHPLTAKFIMHVTGLPGDKWYEFSEPVISAISRGKEDFSAMDRRGEASRQIFAEIERQRANPTHGDDKVIAFLLNVEVEGRKLTQDEIFGMVELMLDGGFDTTLACMGHAFAYLGRNPAARQTLIDDPSKIPAAVDEFLRWVTPQQGLFRTATRDVEIGGKLIKEGEKVFLAWSAANHDPAAFPDPHDVKFDRTSNRHIAFGIGAHLCLGINVAKLEMRIAFETVLARMPDYKLDEAGIVRPPGLGIVNGMEHLPITFTPGKRLK